MISSELHLSVSIDYISRYGMKQLVCDGFAYQHFLMDALKRKGELSVHALGSWRCFHGECTMVIVAMKVS